MIPGTMRNTHDTHEIRRILLIYARNTHELRMIPGKMCNTQDTRDIRKILLIYTENTHDTHDLR